MVTVDDVKKVLKNIFDPEIHISLLDLGLIYGVDVDPDGADRFKVCVRMTLTSPACPYGPALLSKVHGDLSSLKGVTDVKVDLVWIPTWDPRIMASDEAKLEMGLFELTDDDDDDDDPKEIPQKSPKDENSR